MTTTEITAEQARRMIAAVDRTLRDSVCVIRAASAQFPDLQHQPFSP